LLLEVFTDGTCSTVHPQDPANTAHTETAPATLQRTIIAPIPSTPAPHTLHTSAPSRSHTPSSHYTSAHTPPAPTFLKQLTARYFLISASSSTGRCCLVAAAALLPNVPWPSKTQNTLQPGSPPKSPTWRHMNPETDAWDARQRRKAAAAAMSPVGQAFLGPAAGLNVPQACVSVGGQGWDGVGVSSAFASTHATEDRS